MLRITRPTIYLWRSKQRRYIRASKQARYIRASKQARYIRASKQARYRYFTNIITPSTLPGFKQPLWSPSRRSC